MTASECDSDEEGVLIHRSSHDSSHDKPVLPASSTKLNVPPASTTKLSLQFAINKVS